MSSISSIPDQIAVWGDELLEAGNPLGQIIAAHRAGDPGLVAAQKEYASAHIRDRRLNVLWKDGVIDCIRGRTAEGRRAGEEITACSGLRFLRVLQLTIESKDPAEDPAAIFAERGLPASLRELTLLLPSPSSDHAGLYSAIPNIERLELSRPRVPGAPELPQLRALKLNGFQPTDLDALARGRLPQLETLGLAGIPWEALARFGLANSPHLRRLDVWRPRVLLGPPETEDGMRTELRALVESPIAAQVKELELHETLGRSFFAALVANAALFERFEWVRLRAIADDAELKAELKKRLGNRIHYLWED